MANFASWTNEITGSIILVFGITLGIVLIFRHKESRARIVLLFGITSIFVGLIYLVFPLRMLSYIFPQLTEIVFWKSPINDSYVILSLTTYVWIGVTVLSATYLGVELLVPRKLELGKLKVTHEKLKSQKKDSLSRFFIKWALLWRVKRPRLLLLVPAWILMLVWQGFVFFGPNSWIKDPGTMEVIGDTSFKIPSPPFFLMMFFALYLLIFLGLGFLLRAIRTGGVFEEKFVILSVGIFLMILELIFEGIPTIGESFEIMLLLRTLMVVGLLLLNYGLKPSRKKRKNLKLPREVANLAYYVIGETEELDDQFWDMYITKSKEMIDAYKEEKKKEDLKKK
ncbi:MAG: hypothetical protein ACTSRE_12490 [Promethearchaeota archaeon]